MPWKESAVVEERLRFAARLPEGESMSALCLEFGIARETGYRIFNGYKEDEARLAGIRTWIAVGIDRLKRGQGIGGPPRGIPGERLERFRQRRNGS